MMPTWFWLCLLFFGVAHSLTILSQQASNQIIQGANGNTILRKVNNIAARVTQGDSLAGRPLEFADTGDDGVPHSVKLSLGEPGASVKHNYAKVPWSITTMASIPKRSAACLTPYAAPDEALSDSVLNGQTGNVNAFVSRIKSTGRRLLQLQFGVAVLAGAAGGFLEQWLFGGDNNVKDALDAMGSEIHAINALDNTIVSWMGGMQRWVPTVESRLALDQLQISNEQDQIDRIIQNQAFLYNQQNNLRNAVLIEANETQVEFNGVFQDLIGLQNISNVIVNSMVTINNATQKQLLDLKSSISTTDVALQDLTLTQYRIYLDLDMKRAGLQQLWNDLTSTNDLDIYTELFTQNTGIPPMTQAQRDARRNIRNAVPISIVRLLYTSTAGPTEMAISYVCDEDFLLNNTIPGVNFAYFFRQLGPDAVNGTTCYNQYADDLATWSCLCMITVEYWTCTAKGGAPTFPFNWPRSATLHLSNMTSTYCTATPVHTAPVTLASGPPTVYTSLASWNQFLLNFCMNTKTFTTGPGSARVRVTSDDLTGQTDLVLDQTDITINDICNPSYSFLATSDKQPKRLSWNIYELWRQSYTKIMVGLLPKLDALRYGTYPTDIDPEQRPFSRRPDSWLTERCNYFTHIHVSPRFYTIYRLEYISTTYDFGVQVDGGTTYAIQDGPLTVNVPGFGNFSVIKRVDLYTPQSRPDTFMMMGEFENPLHGDVSGTAFAFDTNYASFSESRSAPSRCGDLNYMQIPYANGVPNNVTDFALQFISATNLLIKGDCASESAHLYRRSLVPAGERTICGPSVVSQGLDDFISSTTPIDRDICRLYSQFDIVDNGDSVSLAPTQWSAIIEFNAPGGTFTQKFRTACPTSYEVNRTGETSYVIFNTTSTEPLTIDPFYTNYNKFCRPSDPPRVTYSAARPYFLEVQACGNVFVNIMTLDSDTPCYNPPGIPVAVSHRSVDGPEVNTQIDATVAEYTDANVQSLANVLNLVTQAQLEAEQMARDAPDIASITSNYYALSDNYRTQIANATAANNIPRDVSGQLGFLNSSDYLNNLYQIWLDQQARIALQQNVTVQAALAANLTNQTYQEYLLAQQQLAIENARLIAMDNALSKVKEGTSACDWILVGPMICKLYSIFTDIGVFLAWVVEVVVWIIVIWLLIKFSQGGWPMVKDSINGVCKCCKPKNKTGNATSSSEEVPLQKVSTKGRKTRRSRSGDRC